MKHKLTFKKWMPKNRVTSVSDYLTYIKNGTNALEIPIDKFFDEVIRRAIDEDLVLKMYYKHCSEKQISDSRSAFKKYWEFLQKRA
jgi:hypothetical protein